MSKGQLYEGVELLWTVVCKNLILVWLVSLGLIGKFSYDFLRHKKFSLGYIFSSIGVAVFGGWVLGGLIMKFSPENFRILIPIATMLSFNFVSALMAVDWKALFDRDWKRAFEVILKIKGGGGAE